MTNKEKKIKKLKFSFEGIPTGRLQTIEVVKVFQDKINEIINYLNKKDA